MYPTLGHAFLDLFGLDIQGLKLINTFGLFVALGFVGAALTLGWEFDRKHAEGKIPGERKKWTPPKPDPWLAIALSSVWTFLMGFKLLGLTFGGYQLDGGKDARRFLLSPEGSWVAGFACAALWLAYKLRQRRQVLKKADEPHPEFVTAPPREHLLGVTASVAVGAMLGAKVFHLLERPERVLQLIQEPTLSRIVSGHTLYGGLIVGATSGYLYCRRHKLPYPYSVDAAAPGLMLGYAIGRLGCHFSGDGDWGIASSGAPAGLGWLPSWFWSYDYPNNVVRKGVAMAEGGFPGFGTHLPEPVYPTPLYESLAAFVLFGILWSVRKRIQRPLVMLGLYMVFNAIERFWIEKIRVNATYDLFGTAVTQAELISTMLFFGGLGLIAIQLRKPLPRLPHNATPAVGD